MRIRSILRFWAKLPNSVRVAPLNRLPLYNVPKQSLPTEQVFLEAYDTYADAIFRHCTLRTGDRDLGKDLMQDTFVKTWEYLHKGEVVENIRAFLYKVANNLLMDHYRRNARRTVTSLETMQEDGFDVPDKAPSPARVFEAKQVLDHVSKVEEPYRTAVVMRFVDDLHPREIAELLGVSANVASVRIHRGLKQLEEILTGRPPLQA